LTATKKQSSKIRWEKNICKGAFTQPESLDLEASSIGLENVEYKPKIMRVFVCVREGEKERERGRERERERRRERERERRRESFICIDKTQTMF